MWRTAGVLEPNARSLGAYNGWCLSAMANHRPTWWFVTTSHVATYESSFAGARWTWKFFPLATIRVVRTDYTVNASAKGFRGRSITLGTDSGSTFNPTHDPTAMGKAVRLEEVIRATAWESMHAGVTPPQPATNGASDGESEPFLFDADRADLLSPEQLMRIAGPGHAGSFCPLRPHDDPDVRLPAPLPGWYPAAPGTDVGLDDSSRWTPSRRDHSHDFPRRVVSLAEIREEDRVAEAQATDGYPNYRRQITHGEEAFGPLYTAPGLRNDETLIDYAQRRVPTARGRLVAARRDGQGFVGARFQVKSLVREGELGRRAAQALLLMMMNESATNSYTPAPGDGFAGPTDWATSNQEGRYCWRWIFGSEPPPPHGP